ncbi:MAG: hypothetical protein V4603_06070 [Pseudomonadota bacterium]
MFNFSKTLIKVALLASASAASVQAAMPPMLQTLTAPIGVASNAQFAGGATVSGGANFLTTIPASASAGVEALLAPATADVGKTGNLYMAVLANGQWYMRTSTGYEAWNFQIPALKPFATKTLAAYETISASDIEAGIGASLDGGSFRVHVGYSTSTSPLTYSTAILVNVAAAPGTTCPTGTTSRSFAGFIGKSLCELKGSITTDLHLTNNFDYILSGAVFIGGDNTNATSLTIDAGTTIYGESGKDYLTIRRGSKIHANGGKDAPIVFTTASEDTTTLNTRGRWGGLVINGNAPINGCTGTVTVCTAEGEGSTGLYGGNNAEDNSGNLNYVQVRFPGWPITATNELNGIAFQGVGNGTLVDYIEVYNSADDGVEFFGGTVNAKHVVVIGSDDDNIDWTGGYVGKLQHVVVIQGGDIGDRGIEADNNAINRDSLPRSQPKISNMTIIGNKNTGLGLLLREGTGVNISNLVVKGNGKGCLDMDHDQTFNNAGTSATALTGKLTITNTAFDCPTTPGNFIEVLADKFKVSEFFRGQSANVEVATGMNSHVNSAAVNALTPAARFDVWFDETAYVGAVKDDSSDWTKGWIYRP